MHYEVVAKVSSSLQVVTKLESAWRLYYHPSLGQILIKNKPNLIYSVPYAIDHENSIKICP